MSDIVEEKKVKILVVLDRARSPAAVGYISEHSGIEEPYKLLEELEKDGLVKRTPPSDWSSAGEPRFEFAPGAKKILQEITANKLIQLIEKRPKSVDRAW